MREIKLKTEEQKLYISELEGAILLEDSSYTGYKSDAVKSVGFSKPYISRIGEGITSLRTCGVLTCAAVAWSNKNNHVLLHARHPESLEQLFPVLWEESVKIAEGCKPLDVHVFKDFCADNYEQILDKFMEKNEINFNVKNVYGNLMIMGGGSCEIGPDVLSFEGYNVEYGQKPNVKFSNEAVFIRDLLLKELALGDLRDTSNRIR